MGSKDISARENRVPSPRDDEDPTVEAGDETPVEEYFFETDVAELEVISLTVQSYGTGDTGRDAFLTFVFEDPDGEVLPMVNWASKSERYGDFRYLSPGTPQKPALDQIELQAPRGAVRLRIVGAQFNNGTENYLTSPPTVAVPSHGVSDFSLPDGTPLEYSTRQFQQAFGISTSDKIIALEATFRRPGGKGTTPIRVLFRDEAGNELLPTASLPQNPNFGSFVNLEAQGFDKETTLQQIEVPPGAISVEFHGVDWGEKSAVLYGPLKVSSSRSEKADVHEFLTGLPDSTPLFIIDTTAPPLGHETLSLRPNNLAKAYESLGVAVVFLPFSSTQDKPSVVSDRVIQLDRDAFDTLISTAAKLRSPDNSVFICSSFPSIHSITAAQLLKAKGWNIIYEVRDDMEEFNRVGYSKWYSPALERQMIRIADKTISVSTSLDSKLKALEPSMSNHFVVPNGVNESVIENGAALRTEEAMNRRRDSRKVGYVGHLTKSWFDWPLLIDAAKRMGDVEFEIVGHGMPNGMILPANVKFLGPKTHDELVPIVADWRVGLIPFINMPLTRSVDPNKIYEYFAWGLRCISAPMGAVHEYPSTWVYEGVSEFVAKTYEAVDTAMTVSELTALEEFLETCSWTNRARTMMSHMGMAHDEDGV